MNKIKSLSLLMAILSLAMLLCPFQPAPANALPKTQIYTDDTQAASPAQIQTQAQTFQTDDFVFLVKNSNQNYVIANSSNVTGNAKLKGVAAAFNMLNENLELKRMVNIYKNSYKMRFSKERQELSSKLSQLETDIASGKTSRMAARAQTNYLQEELRKLNEAKVPPLAFVVGDSKNDVSYMSSGSLSFASAAGETIKVPGHIVLQAQEFENMADASKKIDGIIVLAHEAGHMISDNVTGQSNIITDYKEQNPTFLVDDSLKDDTRVVEFMKKGDPMAGSHWRSKVIASVTAFEEGFAEFTAAFFVSNKHDGDNISDNDFHTSKLGHRLNIVDGKVKATFEFSDMLKNPQELMCTEFFIAKLLNRIVMSFKDPYEGYLAILNVKNTDEFIKNPNMDSFIKLFAKRYPQEFSTFNIAFDKEINSLYNNNGRILSDEQQKIVALLKETKNSILSIAKTGTQSASAASETKTATITRSRHISSEAINDVVVEQNNKNKINESGAAPTGIKINELSNTLGNGSIEK